MPAASATKSRELDEGGFTLIELLVVLVIIGVLLAIAVPSYLHATAEARQGAAAADVREATFSAEAYFEDNRSYTGISSAQLKLIDSGLSSDLQTVEAVNGGHNYCISAEVGGWWAHIDGPGGVVVTKEAVDSCP
jgi:type IV pilus assembly protein PilA